MRCSPRSCQPGHGAAIPFAGAMVAMEPDGAVRASSAASTTARASSTAPRMLTASRARPSSSTSTPPPSRTATARVHGARPPASCGNWAPKNYNGGGGSGRTHDRHGCLQGLAQRARSRSLVRGRTREGAGDDAAARRRGREEDLLDGARRHRHHAAAAHCRLCDLRQRRQAAQALRDPRDHSTPRAISSTRASATSRRHRRW